MSETKALRLARDYQEATITIMNMAVIANWKGNSGIPPPLELVVLETIGGEV